MNARVMTLSKVIVTFTRLGGVKNKVHCCCGNICRTELVSSVRVADVN